MCGILGAVSVGQLGPEDTEAIGRIGEFMARRGPDDQGSWSDGRHCVLGFRRLAILDLSPAGHQPMVSGDGRYALVYNGELYNFPELRRELIGQGVQFHSSGDAEVVLHSLIRWGTAALERFNGMYALGLYDRDEAQLLLARDHAGIKPLYYLQTGRGLVFASQFDQILGHPWSEGRPIARDALGVYLRQGYLPAPYAILEGAAQLEPGSWLRYDASGRMQTGRHFEFPRNPVADLRGAEAYEAVDHAVTEAVRRQVISDVPIGTFLSGGVDSPLIAAKLRVVQPGRVHAFTIGTQGDEFDESQLAAQYARELDLDHTLVQATPEQALAMLGDVVQACGEPFADPSIFPTMLISREARRHVGVMLSGDGGDELFWGYVGRFASVLKIAPEFGQPYGLRSLRWGLKKYTGLGTATANLRSRSIGEWVHAKHCHLKEAWARAIFPELQPDPTAADLFRYEGSRLDETAQWLRWNEFKAHLTRVLLKVDRASMHHSLEVRVPLLDRDVIATASRIDWRSCLDLQAGVGKIPLRRSLARHVANQSQAKRGFSIPLAAWLRGPLRPVLEAELLGRDSLCGLPFDRVALRRFAEEHFSGRSDHGWGLWILFSLALWESTHRNGQRTPRLTLASA